MLPIVAKFNMTILSMVEVVIQFSNYIPAFIYPSRLQLYHGSLKPDPTGG
jgi:hypothetical protein